MGVNYKIRDGVLLFHSMSNFAIPNSAFRDEEDFTKLKINEDLVIIGENAFRGCSNLDEIYYKTKTSDESWESNKELRLQELGERAFCGCRNLEIVDLPNSLRKIGDYCFAGCSSLEVFWFPQGVGRIPIGVFLECSNLKVVYIPSNCELDKCAFTGCDNLKYIFYFGSTPKDFIDMNFSEPKSVTLALRRDILIDDETRFALMKKFYEVGTISDDGLMDAQKHNYIISYYAYKHTGAAPAPKTDVMSPKELLDKIGKIEVESADTRDFTFQERLFNLFKVNNEQEKGGEKSIAYLISNYPVPKEREGIMEYLERVSPLVATKKEWIKPFAIRFVILFIVSLFFAIFFLPILYVGTVMILKSDAIKGARRWNSRREVWLPKYNQVLSNARSMSSGDAEFLKELEPYEEVVSEQPKSTTGLSFLDKIINK